VLVPDVTLDEAVKQRYDMIVLPGGLPGADHLNADPRIRGLLKEMAETDRYTAAICAAPKVLASTGLLQGRRVTSFPGALQGFDGFSYAEDAVVQDGRIITSRGPGTAMDFALTLIENLAGKDKRDEVEAGLQRPHH
jgi:4-methyl-5(b-hydroxyethyl)-thiazole monophosphate biosynthesis